MANSKNRAGLLGPAIVEITLRNGECSYLVGADHAHRLFLTYKAYKRG